MHEAQQMHITLLSACHVLGPSLLRVKGWKDWEERIERGREDIPGGGGGAEMKASDLNRKEGRRRRGGVRGERDKENGSERA